MTLCSVRGISDSRDGSRSKTLRVRFSDEVGDLDRAGALGATLGCRDHQRCGLEATQNARMNKVAIHGSHDETTRFAPQLDFYQRLLRNASRGRLGSVKLLLQHMKELGMALDERTALDIVGTCTEHRRFDIAEWLVKNMKVSGCVRSVKTYNTVLNFYASCGRVSDVERCLRTMVAIGMTPDWTSYAALCKAWAVHGQTTRVWHLMEQWEASGMPLTEPFFACLILSCGHSRPPDVDEAEAALCELARRGLDCQAVHRELVQALGVKDADAVQRRVALRFADM